MAVNRLGIVLAALLLAAGCGGSGSDGNDTPDGAATTPAAVSLADTCPKIQDALDLAFEGKPDPSDADYQRFADEVAAFVAVVDPKGEPILTGLVDATKSLILSGKVGSNATVRLQIEKDWSDAMQRVTDTCQQLGAPLS